MSVPWDLPEVRFASNLSVTPRYGRAEELQGLGDGIQEPVNLMSSVFRVHNPSTVKTGQQMGGLGAGAGRPGCKETIVLLICQTHGWSKIFR